MAAPVTKRRGLVGRPEIRGKPPVRRVMIRAQIEEHMANVCRAYEDAGFTNMGLSIRLLIPNQQDSVRIYYVKVPVYSSTIPSEYWPPMKIADVNAALMDVHSFDGMICTIFHDFREYDDDDILVNTYIVRSDSFNIIQTADGTVCLSGGIKYLYDEVGAVQSQEPI
jgi:hypothetical protein